MYSRNIWSVNAMRISYYIAWWLKDDGLKKIYNNVYG